MCEAKGDYSEWNLRPPGDGPSHHVPSWESYRFFLKALWTKQNLTSGQILPAGLDCTGWPLLQDTKLDKRDVIFLKGEIKILIPISQLRVELVSPNHTVLSVSTLKMG